MTHKQVQYYGLALLLILLIGISTIAPLLRVSHAKQHPCADTTTRIDVHNCDSDSTTHSVGNLSNVSIASTTKTATSTKTVTPTKTATYTHTPTVTLTSTAPAASSNCTVRGTNVNLSYCDLHGQDLSSTDMSGAQFYGANLSGANLHAGTYANADFRLANLANANMSNATFTNSKFGTADLRGANLATTILTGANFDLANFSGSDTAHAANLTSSTANNVSFRNTNFTNATLSRANFFHSVMTNAVFVGAKVDNALLQGINLDSINFTDADLNHTILSGGGGTPPVLTTCNNAIFLRANLAYAALPYGNACTGANFTDANLSDAFLTNGTFTTSNFTRANLTNAQLVLAVLKNTNFLNATLTGVTVYNTDFTGATMTGAQLKLANWGAANFTDVSAVGADGTSANFGNANLTRTNFTNANLTGARFNGNSAASQQMLNRSPRTSATCDNTIFVNSVMTNVNMENAMCTMSNFTGATITNANFINANISGSNFTNANLHTTNFTNSNFTNAVFRGSSLFNATIASVLWSNTICPDGSNSRAVTPEECRIVYTATRTATRTATATRTNTNTRTNTATATDTATRSNTPTITNTRTATGTKTATSTRTATNTQTATATNTSTPTITPTMVVQEISASGTYTCAMADNTGWCWGANSTGQLGNKTNTNTKLPVKVLKSDGTTLTNMVHVVASVNGSYSCAITDTNLLWCWGANSSGQLGNGTTVNTNGAIRVKKSASLTLDAVSDVSLGAEHTCAIVTTTVYCWGNSLYGETGLGTIGTKTTYATVVINADGTPFTGVSEISAGFRHTCAVKSGNVWCWGLDLQGQLGDDALRANKVHPVQVVKSDGSTLSDVTHVSSRGFHTCAMTSTGEMWCWGYNEFGQIGDGTTLEGTVGSNITPPSRSRAVQVLQSAGTPLTGVTAIAVGYNNSCALISGAAWCWGLNDKGQLGDGTTTNRLYPVQVIMANGTPLTNVANLSSGGQHTCAVANNKALCWGDNSAGQLGDNTLINKLRAFILGL